MVGGVIQFTVTSDGTTGKGWIHRFLEKGYPVTTGAQRILLSPAFTPTVGVTKRISILPFSTVPNGKVELEEVLNGARSRNLRESTYEVLCLIRDMFSNEEIEAMGLKWIIAFHKAEQAPGLHPGFLGLSIADVQGTVQSYAYERSGYGKETGFVFEGD